MNLRIQLVLLGETGESEDCDDYEDDDYEESTDTAAELLAHPVPVVDVHASERCEHTEDCRLRSHSEFVIDGCSEEISTDTHAKEEEKHAKATKLGLEHEATKELCEAIDNDLSEALVDIK